MDKPSEEDKKWWFWKGEMFADGDWRDRAIAINTKMNIVHEHMESFRRTLDAVLSGYDGLDELRYHHATAFRWLTMLGYWALGAHAKHKQTGRLSRKYPPLACPLPYADFERVPLIKMTWLPEQPAALSAPP